MAPFSRMVPNLPPFLRRWLKRAALIVGVALATVLVVRSIDAWRSPPLKAWHREAPDELDARAIDAADWAAWLAAEDRAFAEVRNRVTAKLPAADQLPINRYFAGSRLNSAHFATDWNHSFVLRPDGAPRGAVVLLHGLTDSPYSLRHIAAHYRDRGFVAIGIRLPGHGTVPAGLTRVEWQDWMAATRLAVRTARQLTAHPGIDQAGPLHLVGYSNGGALALKYALDALTDHTLPRADRIVLLSPMVGITSFARFAGVLGWPSVFPAFAKSAWLDVLPEYNPYKYNSFPVNAARQSSLLSRALQAQIEALHADGRLARLAPVLTFQSALDSTVDARALITSLYARLPANGSELVLFDRNHHAPSGTLTRPSALTPAALLPAAPRAWRAVILTNAGRADGAVEEQATAAGERAAAVRTLAQAYPPDVYSLSHVALPFPSGDALYGSAPDAGEDYGVRLGTVAVRGERGTLIVSADTLMRQMSNPFFPYVLERIDAGIP